MSAPTLNLHCRHASQSRSVAHALTIRQTAAWSVCTSCKVPIKYRDSVRLWWLWSVIVGIQCGYILHTQLQQTHHSAFCRERNKPVNWINSHNGRQGARTSPTEHNRDKCNWRQITAVGIHAAVVPAAAATALARVDRLAQARIRKAMRGCVCVCVCACGRRCLTCVWSVGVGRCSPTVGTFSLINDWSNWPLNSGQRRGHVGVVSVRATKPDLMTV